MLVAYVYHHVAEHACFGAFAHGDGESALQHVLQQTHCLEAHRLAAGIGTRYYEDVTVACQCDVEWYDGLVLLLQCEPKQWVACRNPVHKGLVFYCGFDGVGSPCQFGACPYEIDFGGAAAVHAGEYHYYLTAFVCFEFPYAVVGFHHFVRLHKHGLSSR